jgi:hypothetical protein
MLETSRLILVDKLLPPPIMAANFITLKLIIMKKTLTTILITGLAMCGYAGANTAEYGYNTANELTAVSAGGNATSGIIKGTLGLDVTNDIGPEDAKGVLLGVSYDNSASDNLHYRIGASVTSGRKTILFSLDGFILDANLQKRFRK